MSESVNVRRKCAIEEWTKNKDVNKRTVETVGYVPLSVRVKALYQAGANFVDSMSKQDFYLTKEIEYIDSPSEVDDEAFLDSPLDPTLQPGFDFLEANLLEKDVKSYVKNVKKKKSLKKSSKNSAPKPTTERSGVSGATEQSEVNENK